MCNHHGISAGWPRHSPSRFRRLVHVYCVYAYIGFLVILDMWLYLLKKPSRSSGEHPNCVILIPSFVPLVSRLRLSYSRGGTTPKKGAWHLVHLLAHVSCAKLCYIGLVVYTYIYICTKLYFVTYLCFSGSSRAYRSTTREFGFCMGCNEEVVGGSSAL